MSESYFNEILLSIELWMSLWANLQNEAIDMNVISKKNPEGDVHCRCVCWRSETAYFPLFLRRVGPGRLSGRRFTFDCLECTFVEREKTTPLPGRFLITRPRTDFGSGPPFI